ncbi:MAG TPA: nuclear transport factor 2 family protein, partial [Steroidobacteraceae bacterium]|nr:nuclear transport factor 2 family protein [Steroidobacteraceae bacterium]
TAVTTQTLSEHETGKVQAMSTKEVVEGHLKCFGDGDLAGLLADYVPETVVFRPNGFGGPGTVAKGPAELRAVFSIVLPEFARPGTRFEMRQQAVEGDYAYIVWEAETAQNVYELGSDTFIVKDGKIIAQSIAAKIVPK